MTSTMMGNTIATNVLHIFIVLASIPLSRGEFPWEAFSHSPAVSLSQAQSLYDLFSATRMENSSFHEWFTPDASNNASITYCDFPGVRCDTDDFVISLSASAVGLEGTLPSSLFSLERLHHLDLSHNRLKGTLPPSLSVLSRMVQLNLRGNELIGSLPDFSQMSKLKRLLLDRNAFTGTIPISLCSLEQLVSLDISSNTRLQGSLPSCLSELSNLKALRLTNVGLVGDVPSGLCGSRPMNGLVNNTFGCNGIACPPGSYRKGNGRQISNDTPCNPCQVPSNVLGSTICQWVHAKDVASGGYAGSSSGTPSVAPSLIPSTRPSRGPFVSNAPSVVPTEGPSPSVSFPRPWSADHPTAAPSAKTLMESESPTTFPSTALQAPSQDSTSAKQPVNGIIGNQPSLSNTSERGPGVLIGGSLFAGTLIVVTAVIVWRRNFSSHVEHTGDACSDEDDDSESDVIVEVTTVEPLDEEQQMECLPQQSLSTIDEEDSEVGIPSASPDSSILRSSSASASSSSPHSIRDATSPRKLRVRFTLPDSMSPVPLAPDVGASASPEHDPPEEDLDNRHTTLNEGTPTADTWACWIMNPDLYHASGLCAPDCNRVTNLQEAEDDDQSLALSQGSATSQTPMLGKDENMSSDVHYTNTNGWLGDTALRSPQRHQCSSSPWDHTMTHMVRGRTEDSSFDLVRSRAAATPAATTTTSSYKQSPRVRRQRIRALDPLAHADGNQAYHYSPTRKATNGTTGTHPDGSVEI